MNITWTEITRHGNPKLLKLANIYKPMNSFCKMVGQLLQTELDLWTAVSYTASASSSELTASVSLMASALKNVCSKQQKCKHKQKQLMHSSSNDLHSSSKDLHSLLTQLHGSSIEALTGWTSRSEQSSLLARLFLKSFCPKRRQNPILIAALVHAPKFKFVNIALGKILARQLPTLFSFQRLHGFRQVVQQVCTCRKLIGNYHACLSRRRV